MKTACLRKYQKRLTDEKHLYFSDWPITSEQREACWQILAEEEGGIGFA